MNLSQHPLPDLKADARARIQHLEQAEEMYVAALGNDAVSQHLAAMLRQFTMIAVHMARKER